QLHASRTSYAIGFFASLLVSVGTITWALRILGRLSPVALLAGETTAVTRGLTARRSGWAGWLALATMVGGGLCLVLAPTLRDQEMQATAFFGSGAMFLIAGLAGLRVWMRRHQSGAASSVPRLGLLRLGIRNAARYPTRSLLTAGLLASAMFLVVAVQ